MESADRRRVQGWIRGLVVLGIAGVAMGLLWIGSPLSRPSMRVRVRNATGAVLTGVAVSVSYAGNAAPPHVHSRTSLAPGEELDFNPRTNDVYVTVSFLVQGVPRTLLSGYIDLWTGESYILEIQLDGTLKGDYDHPPP